MDLLQFIRTTRPFIQILTEVPWERFSRADDAPLLSQVLPADSLAKRIAVMSTTPDTTPAAPPVPLSSTRAPGALAKPGCTAADESLVILGHLEGLAEGKQGFGVLATDLERIDRAAAGARQMGDATLAERLEGFKAQLPTVRDAETAQKAAVDLKPLVDEAWELGRRCGASGHVSPELYAKAQGLAERVKAGEISREAAVEALRQE